MFDITATGGVVANSNNCLNLELFSAASLDSSSCWWLVREIWCWRGGIAWNCLKMWFTRTYADFLGVVHSSAIKSLINKVKEWTCLMKMKRCWACWRNTRIWACTEAPLGGNIEGTMCFSCFGEYCQCYWCWTNLRWHKQSVEQTVGCSKLLSHLGRLLWFYKCTSSQPTCHQHK